MKFNSHQAILACAGICIISLVALSLMQGSGQTRIGTGKQATWLGGEQITVQGKNPYYPDLHSLDFIDANTGWVVAEDNKYPETTSQIFRTQDCGAHWEKVAELDNTAVDQLRFVDQTTGWAIAREAGQTTSGAGINTFKILQTKDGGQSWDVQWEEKSVPSGDDLWFWDPAQGYALINGRLLATRNGGQKWSPLSFGADNFVPQHLSFVSPTTGWAIGITNQKDHSKASGEVNRVRLAVFCTTDGGEHWQQQFAREYPDGPVGGINITFINATTGWFLTSNMATMMGDLYYTADGGGDWQKINQIRCNRPSPTELQFITPLVGWIPLDQGAGPIAGGLLATRDGGKSFATVEGAGDSLHEVAFSSPQQGWAVGTALNYSDYLVRTTDGGKSWTQVLPGLRPTQDISFVDDEHGFGLGQLSDNGALLASADGGNTWQRLYSFSPKYRPGMLSFVNGDTGWVLATAEDYYQTYSKTVALETTDGGHSWALLASDIPPIYNFSMSYFRFFDSDHGLVVAAGLKQVAFYRTRDGGRTWQAPEEEQSRGAYLLSFVTPEQGWETYALPRPTTVNLSRTKDGLTWQSLPPVGSDTQFLGLDFISQDYGLMLVQEPPYAPNSRVRLLITNDSGQTWSAHSFPDNFRLEMLSDRIPLQFTDWQHGWMLSRYGLLRTQDGGKTWTAEGEPLGGVPDIQ